MVTENDMTQHDRAGTQEQLYPTATLVEFTGDGVNKEYQFTFSVYYQADDGTYGLQVLVYTPTGVVRLVQNAAYSVVLKPPTTGVGDIGTGGIITTVIPIAAGNKLIIHRQDRYTQEVDFELVSGSELPVISGETFDRQERQAQENRDLALYGVGYSDSGDSPIIPGGGLEFDGPNIVGQLVQGFGSNLIQSTNVSHAMTEFEVDLGNTNVIGVGDGIGGASKVQISPPSPPPPQCHPVAAPLSAAATSKGSRRAGSSQVPCRR